MTNISINTIRDLAKRLYGEYNYVIEENYGFNVAPNKAPGDHRKFYCMNGRDWMTSKVLVAKLQNACTLMNR
jgi:hypothetical protein